MPGLIPQSFVDDLLDRVDIVEVVDQRVKLKKTGKNFSACCPFHQEKTPSFSVSPDKQFYYCFGCGAGGNALGFIMDYDNLAFPQAVEALASTVGMQVPRDRAGSAPPRSDQRELFALLARAARFYQQQLRRHPQRAEAVDYLKGRGLSGEIAAHFGLGYAPPGWDNLLTELDTDTTSRALLLRAGLVVENESRGRYDRFRQRIIFPIQDQRGRVVAFGGRVLGEDQPKYLNSPETEVFHKGLELYGLHQARQANRQLQRLVVVEGYLDVIALAQHGITEVAATLGTATSTAHLKKIYRQCSQIVFCFDGDEAGRTAAARALEAALPVMEDGRRAHFLLLPEGEDPDSLVRTRGPDHFRQLLEQASPLERYLFDHLGRDQDLDDIEGRARLSKLALPLLGKLPAGVYKQLMLEELAKRTGLPAAQVQELVEQASAARPQRQAASEPAGPPAGAAQHRSRRYQLRAEPGLQRASQSALSLLLHRPELAQGVADLAPLQVMDDEQVKLLVELLQTLRNDPESTTAMVLGRWYGSPQSELLNRLASQEPLIPEEAIEQEFTDTLRLLQQHSQRQNLNALMDRLRNKNYAEISAVEKSEIERELRSNRSLAEARSQ